MIFNVSILSKRHKKKSGFSFSYETSQTSNQRWNETLATIPHTIASKKKKRHESHTKILILTTVDNNNNNQTECRWHIWYSTTLDLVSVWHFQFSDMALASIVVNRLSCRRRWNRPDGIFRIPCEYPAVINEILQRFSNFESEYQPTTTYLDWSSSIVPSALMSSYDSTREKNQSLEVQSNELVIASSLFGFVCSICFIRFDLKITSVEVLHRNCCCCFDSLFQRIWNH